MNMIMKYRGYLYVVLGLGIIVAVWHHLHIRNVVEDKAIVSKVLPPADADKIIVDGIHHTITVLSRNTKGQVVSSSKFLPRTGASVDLRTSGGVVVTTRSWGTEVNPFMGTALGSDIRARAVFGLNLFYIQRWELGGGLLESTDIHDTRAYVGGTYNVYSNVVLGVGVDNKKTVHAIVALKF